MATIASAAVDVLLMTLLLKDLLSDACFQHFVPWNP